MVELQRVMLSFVPIAAQHYYNFILQRAGRVYGSPALFLNKGGDYLSVEERIIQLCKENALIRKTNFNHSIYPPVAEQIYKEYGIMYDTEKLRKLSRKYRDANGLNEWFEPKENPDVEFKQNVKYQDQSREVKKELRYEARYENLLETVKECAKSIPVFKLKDNVYITGSKEAILCVSDFHYGAVVNNFKQKFNSDILKQKIEVLKNQVIRFCEINNVKKLNVLNLGDLIHGNIHVSARIESEMDAVSQTMQCAELLATLLYNLGCKIEQVVYRSVLDNHSRINKKYDEHIESENFGRIIDWWLETRLNESKSNVQIVKDNLDDNIGYFKTESGKNVFFVHGHLDNVSTILQSLTFGTDIIADYVFLGHFHQSKMKEYNGRKVFLNGSILGTDSYALDHRLFAKPSQTLVVFDGDDEIDIRINL